MAMIVLRKGNYSLGKKPEERSIKELLASGVVPIDKPCGPSSHEVSSILKKLVGASKSGHSGTLDPNVSGVLPVLLGKATKVAKIMTSSRKEYVCEATFEREITKKELEESLLSLQGEIYQTPPLESAVKKALRTRKVYSLEVLEHEGKKVLFKARVQAGTYIRTLISDAGLLAGVEARMSDLRRTVAAGIPIEKCVTLQEFSDRLWLATEKRKEGLLRECLLPVESVLRIKRVVVADGAVKNILSGSDVGASVVDAIDEGITQGELAGVFTGNGEIVCVARALHDAVKIKQLPSHERLLDVERVLMQCP